MKKADLSTCDGRLARGAAWLGRETGRGWRLGRMKGGRSTDSWTVVRARQRRRRGCAHLVPPHHKASTRKICVATRGSSAARGLRERVPVGCKKNDL